MAYTTPQPAAISSKGMGGRWRRLERAAFLQCERPVIIVLGPENRAPAS